MIVSSKPGPKSNPHSRFIPREEIDEVAAWHFSAIGGSEEPAPSNEEVDAAPATPIYDEQAMHEAREQAYAEGYAEGHEAGGQEVRETHEAAMQQQAEETAVRMGELLHTVTDQLLSSEQKIARQLLEMACELARQVVRQELKTNTRHLRPVIGEALEMMIDDGLPATVHMHPDDLAAMQWLYDNAQDDDVIIEAPGCSYQVNGGIPTSGVAAMTGVPTLIGWGGHESQWRAGQPELLGQIGIRQGDVAAIYADPASPLVDQYDATLLYVGGYERNGAPGCDLAGPYPSAAGPDFPGPTWEPVFTSGDTVIYRRVASTG